MPAKKHQVKVDIENIAAVVDQLPVPAPKRRASNARTNYFGLRLQWFKRNLDIHNPDHYTIEQLALDNKLNPDTVKVQAAQEGWQAQLHELREEVAEQARRQLIAKSGFDELEVRKKHAKFANIAMSKAILGLMQLDPATLSPKEIAILLQLGLSEERKAYGMVESVTATIKGGEGGTIQTAAQAAMDILQRRQQGMKTIGEDDGAV
jgi:hypothetical protein